MLTRSLQLMGSALVATNGAITVTGFTDGGCISAVVRNGAGDYTITLSPAQDALENVAFFQIRGGAGNANLQFVWTSDVALAVTTFVAAVATDEAFNMIIFRTRSVA